MKILSTKKYEALINHISKVNYDEGLRDGKESGYEKGFKQGLHEGLISDKTGVLMNSAGMYIFKDGHTQAAITESNYASLIKDELGGI